MPNRFTRKAPPHDPNKTIKTSRTVKIGDYYLSPFDAKFVIEYQRDFNARRAALEASGGNTSPSNGTVRSHFLLKKPEVLGALHHLLAERREKVGVELDYVVNYHLAMATADTREFNCWHWRCCRYCWGIDNQYQFTQAELRNASQKHRAKHARLPPEKRPLFDEEGGVGFDSRRDPQRGPEWNDKSNDGHSCPECNGKGVPVIEEVDLGKLSYGASLIFDGIKVGRDGSVEFKLNANRSKGMEEVARLLGLTRPKRAVVTPNFDDEDEDVLDAILDEAESRGLIGPGDYRHGKVVDAAPDEKQVDR